jgi:predicted nucleic acid-binding protein
VILVDTSVWANHLRRGDQELAALLDAGAVVTHPFVIGELALGNLRQRDLILQSLWNLPQARVARDQEVLLFIERNCLFGLGIGYVDAHLLAAAQLTTGATLWTHDKRLRVAAGRLGLTQDPSE